MTADVMLISQPGANLEKRISVYINFISQWAIDSLLTISCVFAFKVVWFQLWAKWFQRIVYMFGSKALKWSPVGGKYEEWRKRQFFKEPEPQLKWASVYLKYKVSSQKGGGFWVLLSHVPPWQSIAVVDAMKMGTVSPVVKEGEDEEHLVLPIL